LFAASTSPAGGKAGIMVILKSQSRGVRLPRSTVHAPYSHKCTAYRLPVTTACWANKGEGGTGDTQIGQEQKKKGVMYAKHRFSSSENHASGS